MILKKLTFRDFPNIPPIFVVLKQLKMSMTCLHYIQCSKCTDRTRGLYTPLFNQLIHMVLQHDSQVTLYTHVASDSTRSSAYADNRLDVFSGQTRSTNIVPFHVTYSFLLCNSNLSLRRAVLRYSTSKNVVTLKWEPKITQGHWEWYHSIDGVWFPISVL